MSTLYCYYFDSKEFKEDTVEVIETEKQYRVESGNIPYLYKQRLNKFELNFVQNNAYVAAEPARKEAVTAFLKREQDRNDKAHRELKLSTERLEAVEAIYMKVEKEG